MTDKPFWLGIIGGILGVIAGIIFLSGGIAIDEGKVVTELSSSLFYALSAVAMSFSVIGMISGIINGKENLRGILLIISSVIVLISTSFLGVLTFIMFLTAGILLLKE